VIVDAPTTSPFRRFHLDAHVLVVRARKDAVVLHEVQEGWLQKAMKEFETL
jgi:hypothetical protein